MSHGEHTPEEKAAVLAALLAGQSVSNVARQFNVARQTVRRWRVAAGMVDVPVVNHQKRAELDDLVGNLLRAILTTLQIQAEQFRDGAWLRTQDASELAVLFGVMADKAFRILEAAQSDEPATDVPPVRLEG